MQLRAYSAMGAGAKALMLCAALGFATTAGATPIIGELQMTGLVQAVDDDGEGVSWSDATGINFDPDTAFGEDGGEFLASACTGDFADELNCALAGGDLGTIRDLRFDPFVGTLSSFFEIGGFNFDLLGLEFKREPIDIEGTGILTLNGERATETEWFFSSQATNGEAVEVSWSATTVPTVVPEPATLILLGLGLLGLVALRRRSLAGVAA